MLNLILKVKLVNGAKIKINDQQFLLNLTSTEEHLL